MSEILEQAVFTGTAVVGGAAEGEILADTTELSFWGGIDPETGEVIDRHHPLRGRHITDRILVIPGGRGSCSGSGVLLELLLNGRGPAALVLWNSRSGSITLFTMQYVAREESPIRYSFCREDLFDRHWCIGAVSTYSKRGTRIAVSDHARETGIGLMRFGLFKSTPTPPRRRLERQGEFGQRVTGESYYQRELDRIAGGRTTDGHEFERTAEIVLDDGTVMTGMPYGSILTRPPSVICPARTRANTVNGSGTRDTPST